MQARVPKADREARARQLGVCAVVVIGAAPRLRGERRDGPLGVVVGRRPLRRGGAGAQKGGVEHADSGKAAVAAATVHALGRAGAAEDAARVQPRLRPQAGREGGREHIAHHVGREQVRLRV